MFSSSFRVYGILIVKPNTEHKNKTDKLSPARDLHGRYTSAIGQGGRQDGKTRLREELQHNMRKGRRKKRRPPDYAPRGVQCGSRKKTPQHISTYILQHDRTQDLQRGGGRGDGGKPAQTSSNLVQQPYSAMVTDPPVTLGVRSRRRRGMGVMGW